MTSDRRVAASLEAIYAERGRLLPEDVVEVASAPDHPLHDVFTWGNTEAATRWRLYEAAHLIRSVKIRFMVNDEPREVRVWHAGRDVSPDPEVEGYVPDSVVRRDPVARQILLNTMERDWRALRARYSHLTEFWDMFDAEAAKASAKPKAATRRAGLVPAGVAG